MWSLIVKVPIYAGKGELSARLGRMVRVDLIEMYMYVGLGAFAGNKFPVLGGVYGYLPTAAK